MPGNVGTAPEEVADDPGSTAIASPARYGNAVSPPARLRLVAPETRPPRASRLPVPLPTGLPLVVMRGLSPWTNRPAAPGRGGSHLRNGSTQAGCNSPADGCKKMLCRRFFSPETRTTRQAICPNRMFRTPTPPIHPNRVLSIRRCFFYPAPRSPRIFCASTRPWFLATSFCHNLRADAKNSHARKEPSAAAERSDRAYPASRGDGDGNGNPRHALPDERNAPEWCPCHESGASEPTSICRRVRRRGRCRRRSRKRPLQAMPTVSLD